MSALKEEFFAQYVSIVQARLESLYQQAQQFPANHSLQLFVALEELRFAVEELHHAEEEILLQNEQLTVAQQQAEVERQRYQDLFEFAPDGYLVTDLKGVVQEANYASVILLNIEQEFLIGKPLVACVAQPARAGFLALLAQLQTARRIQGWELALKPAEPVTAEITVETVQSAEGFAVGLRWQLRDISDRKKAQAALSQLQTQNLELLEADRLRTQLLATVSHELKTPLTAILGFSQVLMGQFGFDAKAAKMVERIFHNGQHLLGLIESMLNFSRLRAHQIELQLETFDLIELVSTTLDDLSPLADQKALALVIDLPASPVWTTNDRTRLRQVITNLWSNAVNFTDTGRVVVRVEALPAERLLLVVQDTGCGISPADQSYIFQEFWQVHNARTTVQGTGLGLAIVHALVNVMQGSVTVESELGQGSQFRVELPQIVLAHPASPSWQP
ncbi:MAG: PAS domain-containing sensor histidine kinase [Nodosilinea sp.]